MTRQIKLRAKAHATAPPMRVLLLNMPWGAIERPALGLSLLEAGLHNRGMPCRTLYLNLRLADKLGADTYSWINHDLPHIAFVGEWLFAEALHGQDETRDAGFVQHILRDTWRMAESNITRLLRARSAIEPFLVEAQQMVEEEAPDLVGFTSTFEQNLASLALAKRLKANRPDLVTAFGGANWEGPMGHVLHRVFPFVDLAFSGEADESFPTSLSLFARYRYQKDKREAALAKVPGLVFRRSDGSTASNGPANPIDLLDELPIPDYAPYFSARDQSAAAQEVPPVLLFEASRGCWWGAKSHCTFCGLNGHSMGYRSKTAPRLLAELEQLFKRWPCPTVEAVDNILDMNYFGTVLPALEQQVPPGPVFFEVKANMRRHHVAQLARAHVLRIQPGIESLSDHILKLMRKGTTCLRNVQLLKWCREYGISVDWNLLYGFPGETDSDYEEMLELLPKIAHLQAPGACGPIRMDRFSPYFNEPERFGLTGVQPLPVYRFLYPAMPQEALSQVANYFEFDYRTGFEPSQRVHAVVEQAERQRNADTSVGNLQALPHQDGGLVVRDTRAVAKQSILRFNSRERCILERIDEVSSVQQVCRTLEQRFSGEFFGESTAQAFLDYLVDIGLALRQRDASCDKYLGLALMTNPIRLSLEAHSRSSARVRDSDLAPKTLSARVIPINAASKPLIAAIEGS
jgi:ribosomal peptide maturation radical SAM protein 1